MMHFKKYYYFAAAFYIVAILIHVIESYFSTRTALIRYVDTELLQSARSAALVLPAGFHYRNMLEEGLHPTQDTINRHLLSGQVKNMEIKYLYTMIMEDQKVIFTSSSATAQEEATGKNLTHFGDVYAEASPILKNAFKTRRITTDDSTDTWGTFHTLYLPQVAQDGTVYVIGADIELTLLNEQLKQNVLNSLKDIFIYFILMLPFVFVYRAHVHYNQHELEDIIAKRVKELQEQKYALDAHAIVAITDTKGTITFVNSKFEAISGYSHAELIGQNHRLINSGTHTEAFWKEMYHTISHGNVWHADICNRAKNGELYWVDTTIIPSMNTLGKPESYISIQTDITAFKNSREQILQKEEMLQTLLDSVAEGIYGVDSMGNCTFVNKAFLRILGYDDENEILGQHIHELTHHTRKDGTPYPSNECQIYKTNREHLCAHVEDEVFWKRDGTCIDVEYWSYPILRNGKCVGAVATFLDTTEQNRLKEEHEKQEKFLLQQIRLAQMGEMISMIAHQWRQPLGAIGSTAVNMKLKIDLESFDLETSEGREEQKIFLLKKLNNIESYVENLSKIIDDFRNFYRPDKQTVQASFQEVIAKALAIVHNSMATDNIKIIEEYDDNTQIEMHDNEMLQVILNIFKNAHDNFKEKQIASPLIKVSSHNNTLFICDNGGGIPKDVLERIFDPYFSTKDEKNGTGLGLYMSKTIVEDHHHGKLRAYNQNDGVCFEINLENTNA